MRSLLALVLTGGALLAQGPLPRVISPEVQSDRRVTFRLRAPNAMKVMLNREGARPVEMTKDPQGIWTVTTDALEPDMYGYTFNVDGVGIMDPSNSQMKPNLLSNNSLVHVPSDSQPWEVRDVPRGSLHRHFYRSKVVGDDRDFYVYTPPNYDPKGKPLPVLYLFHGFSDDASGWTAVGRAHVILDNLIAQGKAKPMLVVMPLGYGAPEILKPASGGFGNNDLRKRNFEGFKDALIGEVMPVVEKSYRASKNRNQRAIAGLSMGGAESLIVGLNNLDLFAWVGAFSAGGFPGNLNDGWPLLTDKANDKLKLLWIGCGKDDFLFNANNQLAAQLKERNIKHQYVVTDGAHTWMVWRRYLATFVPMLFAS